MMEVRMTGYLKYVLDL